MLEKLAEVLETRAGDEYELEHLPEGETKSVLAMLAIWGGITFTGSGVLVGG